MKIRKKKHNTNNNINLPLPPLPDYLREIPVDRGLVKNNCLGPQKHTCKICGTTGNFQTYLGIEMFQGSRDEFLYFACSNCICLQIDTVPDNLGKYYAGEYYSFTQPNILPAPVGTPLKNDFILDVGCGAGRWLCEQATEGQQFLFGCDPFAEKDLYYTNGVQIRKCSIHEMTGSFDLIRFADSFEHVTDPHETLDSVKRLLKPNGQCIIKVPVFPNASFTVFGPWWYQMDPPRHISLHSFKSMGFLAQKHGLSVDNVALDGSANMFHTSRLSQMGIPFNFDPDFIRSRFTKQENDVMDAAVIEAIKRGQGDHCTFTLRHASSEK